MDRFENIPNQALQRLPVGNSRLKVPTSSFKAEPLRVLGIKWSAGGYEIIDWSYYDWLKKYGYRPSLANMIALHNEILGNR